MKEQEGNGVPTRIDSSIRIGSEAVVTNSAVGEGANVTMVDSPSGSVAATAGFATAVQGAHEPSRARSNSLWRPSNILAGAVASLVAVVILWVLGALPHIYHLFTTRKP